MTVSRAATAFTRSNYLCQSFISRSRAFESLGAISCGSRNVSRRSIATSWIPTPIVSDGEFRSWDIFSRLLKERIVIVNGPIDDSLAATITAQLLFLEADNPEKDISVYINSPGGSVSAGLACLDTIQYIAPDVSTICMGQAASMGSLLLCAGTPGKRYALPHSSIMVHQPSGGFHGQASDIALHAKEILRVREQLNKIYFQHLKAAGKEKSMEDIEKLMERDNFMSAETALEIGIIDEILTSRKASQQK